MGIRRHFISSTMVPIACGAFGVMAWPITVSYAAGPALGPARALDAGQAASTENAFSHHIVTDRNGRWLAAWHGECTTGTTCDIFVASSTNAGASWSTPRLLVSEFATDDASDSRVRLATDGAGNWVAVWDSGSSTTSPLGADLDILVSRSSDNGDTWSSPAALNTNATSDLAVDFTPQISTDGGGNWVAIWTSSRTLGSSGIDYDVLVARSTDNGLSWTDPVPVDPAGTTDDICEVGSDIEVSGSTWVAAWYSYNNADCQGFSGPSADVWSSRSTNGGAAWSAPVRVVGASDDGPDFEPKLAVDSSGTWLMVWHSNSTLGGTVGDDRDILLSRSVNDGVDWNEPVALATDAAADADIHDETPEIVFDGAGNWVAVWSTHATFGGTAQSEKDIAISSSTDGGLTWSTAVMGNSNGATTSGDDVSPQLVADGAGAWIAMWSSSDTVFGPGRNIIFARGAHPCGDNDIDPGEACDDGNTDDGDCCSSMCAIDSVGTACVDTTLTDCFRAACDGAGACIQTAVGIPSCCDDDLDCDDSLVCTKDTCDLTSNTCQAPEAIAGCCVDDQECDDGRSCTTDSCDTARNQCAFSDPASGCCDSNNECDDGLACTTNTCDLVAHVCEAAQAIAGCCDEDADCSDGDVCTRDSCDLNTNTCAASTAIAGCCEQNSDCDDGDACTNDVCDTAQNTCNAPARIRDCGPSDDGGCSCQNSNWAGQSPLWAFGILGLGLFLRRRRNQIR